MTKAIHAFLSDIDSSLVIRDNLIFPKAAKIPGFSYVNTTIKANCLIVCKYKASSAMTGCIGIKRAYMQLSNELVNGL